MSLGWLLAGSTLLSILDRLLGSRLRRLRIAGR
jgi:hypothetical protein